MSDDMPHTIANAHWVQRTFEAIQLQGKSERTAKAYTREVRIMGHWLKQDLALATDEDLRDFALYRINDCELGGSSVRIMISGLRYLFTDVLPRDWVLLDQLNAKREETLPLVLTPAEVQGIIQHADSLCHKTYLQLVYTCGLRLSEGRNVKVDHIDGQMGRPRRHS